MIDPHTVFLVVDGSERMRTVTISQLRALGATHVLSAANGLEALRELKSQRVDLVLSDWNMPVMSGLDLLKIMRANPKMTHLPFLMITREMQDSYVREAIATGVTSLLIKPYTLNRLAVSIEKALCSRPRQASCSADCRPGVPPASACAEDFMPTEFTMTVPHSEDAVASQSVRPTLLIVDDTPDNLMLLSSIFKDEYRVRLAQNGEKALAICHSESPPDLVLLDVMMPSMNGFEVIAKMREHPASEFIPVIFVTAMVDDMARSKGLELGAVDYVTKPVDPATLKLRVRNFMRYVTLHKQLQTQYDDMVEMAQLRQDVEHITQHDLIGPLSSVVGLLQLLIKQGSSMTPTQLTQLRTVEMASVDVLNMVTLSSELLKIETGRFKLEAKPIAIGALLGRIIDVLKTAYSWKQLVISVYDDVCESGQALGEATLCYSMLNNLLKNACEAAPDGSAVTVSLCSGDALSISIENVGVVPPDIRESFFEKFVTSGKDKGMGLGTYSARLLARAQNGDISLKVCDADNLTTVTVMLPNH
jgi:CheY-like chemotaxis protein